MSKTKKPFRHEFNVDFLNDVNESNILKAISLLQIKEDVFYPEITLYSKFDIVCVSSFDEIIKYWNAGRQFISFLCGIDEEDNIENRIRIMYMNRNSEYYHFAKASGTMKYNPDLIVFSKEADLKAKEFIESWENEWNEFRKRNSAFI